MPTLKDFIARVVPWPSANQPGVVNIHWRMIHPQSKNLIWAGRATSTADDFVGVVDWANQRQQSFKDIYFCTSLQGRTGRSKNGKPTVARSQQDAVSLRSIWLDIDVKDPPRGYANLNEALKALDVFIKAYKLPFPTAIVETGGGMHVYWVSDKIMSPDEWRPYAEGLREAAVQHGLRCDAGVTIDSARILRVPGTYNWKIENQPRAVAIKHLEPTDINFPTALTQLAVIAPHSASVVTAAVTPGFDLSGFTAGGMSKAFAVLGTTESLAEGIEHNSDPLDPRPILAKTGCPFFRDTFAAHGKDTGQGLWNLVVLASTFWQNGETFAHELSNGYPTYKAEETDALIERKTRERAQRGLGWPSCASFEREGATQCKGCPHRGNIRSPLNLALTPKAPPPNVVTPQQLQQSSAGLDLPKNFAVDPKTGFICEIVTLSQMGQSPVQELIPLFKCRLSAAWAQKDPDALNFRTSTDLNNTRDVSIPYSSMVVLNDLMRQLGNQMVKHDPRNKNRLENFFVSWMAELHAKQAAIASVPFGWIIEEGKVSGFAYGGVVAKPDGTEKPGGQADPKLRAHFAPCGDMQVWLDAVKLITGQHRPALEIIVAASLAAPLIHFTNVQGVTISTVGPSGLNKSAAAEAGMAVWGNPLMAKEVPTSSEKQVEKKVGEMRNLPIYWDEIKDQDTQHKVFNGVFSMSEGVSGGKLKSDRSMQDKSTWQTLMVCNSNYNLGDYFIDVKQSDAAALYRVFEYKVERTNVNTPGQIATFDADRVFKSLQYNYGNAGRIYAKHIVTNYDAINKMVHDDMVDYATVLDQTQNERLWVAMCGAVVSAARISNAVLGTDFHLNEIRDFLITQYKWNRDRARKHDTNSDSVEGIQDLLTQFFKHYAAHTVVTRKMQGSGFVKIEPPLWPLPNPNAPARAMHIHIAVEDRLLRLSKKEFQRYLQFRKLPGSHTVDQLVKHFGANPSKYATIGSGTTHKRGQEYVIEIPVPIGSPLETALTDYEGTGLLVPPPVEPQTADMPTEITQAMAQAAADLNTVKRAA